MYKLYKTSEFDEWLISQPLKSRLQIEDRLLRIAYDDHFGVHKKVAKDIWELKWANGRRIYYAYLEEYNILLLLGGNKNGQGKDITQAEKILKKNVESTPETR
jgi:putative addiction module killer protein